MTSESNQHDEKRFGPKLSSFKAHNKKPSPTPTRSYSPIANNVHPTRHAGDTDKKLVFVKKNKSNNNFSKNRPVPKKGAGMRKVTSESEVKKEHVIPELAEGTIRIIPLGGVEQIGQNMTAIEYGDDIIVVDAGIQFKTEDTPGIDYILPNTKYLEARKGKIRGLAITHGHLDHIGAIPFVMDALGNPPIYAREFAAIMIKKRQEEFQHMPPLNIKIVDANTDSLPVSPNIKLKFFGVTHSIPESTGVIISTPLGDIVITGDLRVDSVNGVPTEEEAHDYAQFKNRNILLLGLDSTGVEKQGWGINEDVVIENIEKIVKDVPGRILIGTFASQVERILRFIDIAKKYGKSIVIEGRSMKNNIEIIKFLKLADTSHIIPVEDIANHPPHKLMILSTGPQGEQFSALMRMANNSHKYIKLNKSDTIILSSSVIPGNEKAVANLKDNLYRHDAKIITHTDNDVHSGGHGKRGELEWIQKTIPHKFFMPMHGHHYMLKISTEVAMGIGMPRENIVVPDNGSIIEIYDNATKIKILKEKAPSGVIMVDGFSVGDVQEVVIRDRQMLAQDGIFVIVASVDVTTGKLRKSPDIITRGFVYIKESQDLLKEARFIIKKTVEEGGTGNPIDFDLMKETITDNVSRYLFQETAKKPMVIPVVIGV